MKRIDRHNRAEIERLAGELADHTSKLETAISAYNEGLTPLKEAVEEAINAYNEAIGELVAIYAEIHSEAQSYYEDRSERWQEGENGQQYQEWLDKLQSPDMDTISIAFPDDIELPSEVPDWNSASEFLPAEAPDEM